MEIYTGQNLFNVLSKMCDYTALDSEMQEVIDAIKKDNPQLQQEVKKMKHIDEYYKDWCGTSHTENAVQLVHDSAEAIDFAEYYHKEMQINLI